VSAIVSVVALSWSAAASAYGWPLKPFHKMHAVRAGFNDPRYHVGLESSASAFHFGVDIAGKDGTRVYAVAPGYVHRYGDHVTISRTGTRREFGYWHIKPAVHTGQHVRLHQFLGTIGKGWGHVHFAESDAGRYTNPLRKGALTPFSDRKPPVIASIALVGSGGTSENAANVTGMVDVEAEIYDLPPIAPKGTWKVARLAPSLVMWQLSRDGVALSNWNLSADFTGALMPPLAYPWIYAPGTYQNKANRPGRYLFWITHMLDTTSLPNGTYTITVLAEDMRFNEAMQSLSFRVANSGPTTPTYVISWPGGHAE
jgi:murein DD-endopeptidase MepM/ murein hydrolase activator NlpD